MPRYEGGWQCCQKPRNEEPKPGGEPQVREGHGAGGQFEEAGRRGGALQTVGKLRDMTVPVATSQGHGLKRDSPCEKNARPQALWKCWSSWS